MSSDKKALKSSKRPVKDDLEAVVDIVNEHVELKKRIMSYIESKIDSKKLKKTS